MKNIKLATILFEGNIQTEDIRAFRAAIIEMTHRRDNLLHHHLDDKVYLYRYPLVQYKEIHGYPAMVCLNDGALSAVKIIEKKGSLLHINGKILTLNVKKLNFENFSLNYSDKIITYRLYNWLALNQNNYQEYQNLFSQKERLDLLERILKAHILAFAEGIGWNIDKPITLFIKDLHKQRWLPFKNIKLLGFDISFMTNLFLPDHIGLGKAVSIGFGILQKDNNKFTKKNSNSTHDAQLKEHNKRIKIYEK